MNGSPAPVSTAVVLDPHPVCQEGLRWILARLGIEVVGVGTSRVAALALVGERRPDLLVADIALTAGTDDGVRCVREARERRPELAIVVVSAVADPAVVEAALDAGASAFVSKTAQPDDVVAEIRQALAPSIYLVGGAGRSLPESRIAAARATIAVPTPAGGVARLTRRELEVLRLVEGRSNRQVAKLLWVTDDTVKFHLANVYRKLGVSSRAEAVEWASANGLLEPKPDWSDGGAGRLADARRAG